MGEIYEAKKRRELTDKQREILSYLEEYYQVHGVMPTQRELSEFFRFRSANSAWKHLDALRRKGMIEYDSKRLKLLTVTNG